MPVIGDVGYAVRGLRRTPAFTLAAVTSLTLGISASTTMFSLIDAAILRSPPFAEANRLAIVNITQRSPVEGDMKLRWSWRRFELLARNVRAFEEVASSSNAVLTVTGVEDPEPLPIEIVSPRYLNVMRASIVLGSGSLGEGTAPPAIVLGYDLWRRRFGGAEDVIGRTLALNGVPLTIVGVADRGFSGVSGLARAWIPATVAPLVSYRDYLTTNQNFITAIGRLRNGVTLDAARAELAILGERIHAEEPSDAGTPDDRFSATAIALNDARVDVVTRRALLLLGGAVSVLLFIACANVAGLLLGRAVGRRREIAIRVALGARRGQLVRQLLLESGALAVASGVVTLLVLIWTLPFVRIPPTLSRGRNFYGAVGEFATPVLDWRVLAFTTATCAFTLLVFGLVPALRATRPDVETDLRSGGVRTVAGGRSGMRELIVACQVALAVVLVVGCGLLLTSYARLRQTSLGFDPDRLLTFMIRPSEVKYTTSAAPALLDRVLEEIDRVKGVDAATVDGCAPLSMQCASASLRIIGRSWAGQAAPVVSRHYVAPAHFKTLGIPIVRGRGISASDRAGRPNVVVINQAAAEKFWPGEDPIGKRVWFEEAAAINSPESSAEVVGIAGNVAYRPLDEDPIQPGFFTPYAQFTYPHRIVIVRARQEPLALVPEIARAVRRADPDLALFDVQTMESRANLSWAKHAFQTALFAIIGCTALWLAVTGVYAVASHMVASRTREIGVRIALGASALQIANASIAHTLRVGLLGTAMGLAGATMLARVLRATLYQTSPFDGAVFTGTVAILFAALIAATYLPVRRALRVNPVEVLSSE